MNSDETDKEKIHRLERENEDLRSRDRMTRLPGQVEALSTDASGLAHRLAVASRCAEEEDILAEVFESARQAKKLTKDMLDLLAASPDESEDIGPNIYVTAMLSAGRSSDELHEEVVEKRHAREAEIVVNGTESDYEDARGIARGRHSEIERAVAWIEEHPDATGAQYLDQGRTV